jgi:hypothetical protein
MSSMRQHEAHLGKTARSRDSDRFEMVAASPSRDMARMDTLLSTPRPDRGPDGPIRRHGPMAVRLQLPSDWRSRSRTCDPRSTISGVRPSRREPADSSRRNGGSDHVGSAGGGTPFPLRCRAAGGSSRGSPRLDGRARPSRPLPTPVTVRLQVNAPVRGDIEWGEIPGHRLLHCDLQDHRGFHRSPGGLGRRPRRLRQVGSRSRAAPRTAAATPPLQRSALIGWTERNGPTKLARGFPVDSDSHTQSHGLPLARRCAITIGAPNSRWNHRRPPSGAAGILTWRDAGSHELAATPRASGSSWARSLPRSSEGGQASQLVARGARPSSRSFARLPRSVKLIAIGSLPILRRWSGLSQRKSGG